MKLTARQTQVLDIIRRYLDETGYPPTRAEIAAELGFRSANAAEEHLRALARKGAIEMVPGASRGIRLPDVEADLGLPVIGQVAAGSPILAQEHIEDHCTLQPEFFSPSADYLLRVRGMSMKDIGILDGDLLAVHRTHDVHNGQFDLCAVEYIYNVNLDDLQQFNCSYYYISDIAYSSVGQIGDTLYVKFQLTPSDSISQPFFLRSPKVS